MYSEFNLVYVFLINVVIILYIPCESPRHGRARTQPNLPHRAYCRRDCAAGGATSAECRSRMQSLDFASAITTLDQQQTTLSAALQAFQLTQGLTLFKFL